MKFNVVNVKGDGSCFYRCLWRVASSDSCVAEDLALDEDDLKDEDVGVREIRRAVAWSIENSPSIIARLDDLSDLYFADRSLVDVIPILEHVDKNATLVENAEAVAACVRQTNTYASQFELETVRYMVDSTDIIVLACESFRDLESLGDKWLREIHAALRGVTKPRLAIVLNEANMHYRVLRFGTSYVLDTHTFRVFIEDRMNEESDESD